MCVLVILLVTLRFTALHHSFLKLSRYTHSKWRGRLNLNSVTVQIAAIYLLLVWRERCFYCEVV